MRDNGGSVTDMTTRTNNRNAPRFIAQREDFTTSTGSLRGQQFHGELVWPVGRLPEAFIAELREYGDAYVVFSYSTPIAWYANGVWSQPAVKYSVTTSKHQGITRMGITQSANGVYA